MKKRVIVLLALSLIALTIAVASVQNKANVRRQQQLELVAANERTARTPIQPQRSSAEIESEIVTITPHGFEPREITRPAGAFLLMIDDRSGLSTVAPQLRRAGGPTLLELNITREEPNWSDIVNWEPGMYLLTEPDHPSWLFRLRLTQ